MRGLSFPKRLKLAGKALVGVFDQEAATVAHGLLAGIFRGSQGAPPERSTAELLNTYNTSPWVRACAGLVADSMSALHWRLFVAKSPRTGRTMRASWLQKGGLGSRLVMLKQAEDVGEVREVKEHLFLDVLRNGNSILSGGDQRWLISLWTDLVGDAFLIKQRNGLGAPVALWPVPPHWVTATPTPSQPYFKVSYRGWVANIPQTELFWHSHPNPVNPYWRGTGTAKALDDELAAHEYSSKHRLAFYRNSARPDILVMPKEGGTLLTEERDRLEQWWTDKLQSFWRSFKPLFLTRPMDVKLIEQNFQTMQFTELNKQDRDTITQVWRIPPELFGILASSNRSTIDRAPMIFGRYCLVPRAERLREALQTKLIPEYDDRLILDYDSPVPEDREFQLNVMRSQPSAFQKNEYRRLAEMAPDEHLEDQYGESGGASIMRPEADMARELIAQMDDEQVLDLLAQAEQRR